MTGFVRDSNMSPSRQLAAYAYFPTFNWKIIVFLSLNSYGNLFVQGTTTAVRLNLLQSATLPWKSVAGNNTTIHSCQILKKFCRRATIFQQFPAVFQKGRANPWIKCYAKMLLKCVQNLCRQCVVCKIMTVHIFLVITKKFIKHTFLVF